MDEPLIRVMALHALAYCERLFFLEEVEEIRVADEAVWEGRRLHEELDEVEELTSLTLESEVLGLRGRLDAARRRGGGWFPVEHKRGRAFRDPQGNAHLWLSDLVQVVAYALLLEEHVGAPVLEARVRYHRDNVTVRCEITEYERRLVLDHVARARALRAQVERPPVTTRAGSCVRCSLAPVCLPEEGRLASALERQGGETPSPVRLYPPDAERRALHVTTQGAKVGLSRGKLRATFGSERLGELGLGEISDVVLHGYAQITTQALRTCASEGIPVHWLTQGGAYTGSFFGPNLSVQRKVRQYDALRAPDGLALALACRVVEAKIAHQTQLLMRATRGDEARRDVVREALASMRRLQKRAARASDVQELLGFEGSAAKLYFEQLPSLVLEEEMRPSGRTRRPPRDPFNALLSFCYGLLYRDVLAAIIRVGLEPTLGLMHTPRSAAPPLVLDLMEIFRVPIVDLAVLGAVNRKTFSLNEDFELTSQKVWLSEAGRRKAIALYERRKHEEYRHPMLDYSLSYARMMELEVRLLEKEWMGESGLFATFRFR